MLEDFTDVCDDFKMNGIPNITENSLKKPELMIPRISACLAALVSEEAPAKTTFQGDFLGLGVSVYR